ASPWSKEDLLKPVNSNQYRYCAKHKFKQKHYMAGIFNYLKYYKEKCF
ncbi:TPA: glycosyltransferase family 8 C-terminal domain-containing protein, partial [Escherichia coli O103:H2]